MATKHEFGGSWTDDKLERIRKYLVAYTTIFTKNVYAKRYTYIYVDAFAGTGYRSETLSSEPQSLLFPELVEPEAEAFLKGSTRIALEVEPPFKRYIFIEQSPNRARELHQLKTEFPDKAGRMEIAVGDANGYLLNWCKNTNWRLNRAVVFLDPYGMQVEWPTIQAIAETRAIDLWILFPLGVAVNRMLTKSDPPPEKWAQALSRLFGTSEWRAEFYPQQKVLTLFGEEERQAKDADFGKISAFFVERLQDIFEEVAKPLPLYNSKNIPLFLLCFAAGNPRGAPTAIKIAGNILQR